MSYVLRPIIGEEIFYDYNEELEYFEVRGSQSGAVIFTFEIENEAEEYCKDLNWKYYGK